MTEVDNLENSATSADGFVWSEGRDIIPNRFNRIRFSVRAWLLWNYLNARNARINILDRCNENNGALSEQELESEWAQSLGEWALKEAILATEAREKYIANRREVVGQ